MPSATLNHSATVIGKSFCRLIFPINRSSAKRWGEIFVYSAIATPILGLLFEIGYNRFWDFNNDYFPFGDYWLVFFLGVFLILWSHWIAGFKPRQILLFIKYPGVPVAVFLALFINSLCVRWSTDAARNNREILWFVTIGYGALLFLIGICAAACDLSRKVNSLKWRPLVAPKTKLSELSADKLISWIQDPKEISDCAEDYFDFSPRAGRVLKTLRKKERQCVAIVGPYGGGKSSLIRLVERESERSQNIEEVNYVPLLWFCFVSCWGFEKGDSAPEAILRQVVEQVHRRVDCLAIRGLPSRYMSGLSKLHNYVDMFLNMTYSSDPTEQVKKLSPILNAINVRLVIVLEDVDRNGTEFDVHQIEGLLTRLKEINEIAFIISAGQDCKLDFIRLVEHSETLPLVEWNTAIEIIDQIRKKYCDDSNTIVLPSRKALADDSKDFNQQLENSIWEKRGYQRHDKWNWQIAVLLDTPRALKSGLRRFVRAWENLKGEVNIDQLLVASALRERSPRHFGFVQQHWSDFPWLGKEMKKSENNSVAKCLQEEWDNLTDSGSDRLATRKLMTALFPIVNKLENNEISPKIDCCQSVFDIERGQIYRDRIFNEHITTGPLLDQPMLHLIADANQNEKGLHTLAAKLAKNEVQFDHFYFLREASLKVDRSCPLLSAIFKYLREHDGRKAKLDQFRLGNLAQKIVIETRGRRSEIFEWAKSETLKCFPNHLTLAANLIEYLLPPVIATQELVDVRILAVKEMEKSFANAPVETFVQSIDEESSDTLRWLVFEDGQISMSKWFGPLLLRAVRKNPEVIIPQILELGGDVTQSTYGDGRQSFSYEFRKQQLNNYFGKFESNIITELANYELRTDDWALRNGSISPLQVCITAKNFLQK